MQYSVPIHWDNSFISSLLAVDRQRKINEVYGRLPALGKARAYIEPLRRYGVRINYLFDELCMDNLEFTRAGQRRIMSVLDSFVQSEADAVTVAIPYLAMLIKKRYPALSVIVSAAANINTARRAQFWETLGVDCICLPGPIVNHDLSLLRIIRRSIKCKIRLVANGGCIRNCPVYLSHRLLDSHSQVDKQGAVALDYYRGRCMTRRLKNPELFIRSDWIRPEDTGVYDDLGIDSFQLVDTSSSGERMLKITGAYLSGSFDGNLIDLLQNFPHSTADPDSLPQARVFIDNKKLDGFLLNMPNDCDRRSCNSCSYCKSAATAIAVSQ